MSDRVIVLSAGPGTHPIGEFAIDLQLRPRDVGMRSAPIRASSNCMPPSGRAARGSALKGYAQQKRA